LPVLLLLLGAISGCGSSSSSEFEPPKKLSELGLFEGNGSSQKPLTGVIPYDLATPLFSDYASKYRFLKLPEGQSAEYDEVEEFSFPVGTVIAKTFAYPHDMRDPSRGERLIETRILWHQPQGWVAFPYIWNEEQTEATLEMIGGRRDVSWIHTDGQERSLRYSIPNANQCKGCHKWKDKEMLPIGPKARNLNTDFVYEHGSENQLAYWSRIGALKKAPVPVQAPRLAVWDDESTGTLEERARAWLEINCAHCHNPRGPARNSGLDLTYAQNNPYNYGVFRSPVASGRGNGGLPYDIVPGKPDDSIMLFRLNSSRLEEMMPELGRSLVHEESAELIRDWIAAMEPADDESADEPAPAQ
jgi:uncharacterized repeat protein (TIGR03806 family)